jgi:hypothetical protein
LLLGWGIMAAHGLRSDPWHKSNHSSSNAAYANFWTSFQPK